MNVNIEKAITGMAFIADVASLSLTREQVIVLTFVSMGEYADEIKEAVRYKKHNIDAMQFDTDEDFNAAVDREYEFIRDLAKRKISRLVSEQVHREHKANVLKQHADRVARMRALSAQNPAGTTAELTALLGVSKASIRKARADGTLDGLIAMAKAEKESQNGAVQ